MQDGRAQALSFEAFDVPDQHADVGVLAGEVPGEHLFRTDQIRNDRRDDLHQNRDAFFGAAR